MTDDDRARLEALCTCPRAGGTLDPHCHRHGTPLTLAPPRPALGCPRCTPTACPCLGLTAAEQRPRSLEHATDAELAVAPSHEFLAEMAARRRNNRADMEAAALTELRAEQPGLWLPTGVDTVTVLPGRATTAAGAVLTDATSSRDAAGEWTITARQIAAAFDVPPHVLGIGDPPPPDRRLRTRAARRIGDAGWHTGNALARAARWLDDRSLEAASKITNAGDWLAERIAPRDR